MERIPKFMVDIKKDSKIIAISFDERLTDELKGYVHWLVLERLAQEALYCNEESYERSLLANVAISLKEDLSDLAASGIIWRSEYPNYSPLWTCGFHNTVSFIGFWGESPLIISGMVAKWKGLSPKKRAMMEQWQLIVAVKDEG